MNNTTQPNLLRAAATYGLYIGIFLILCHLLSAVAGLKLGFFIQFIKLAGSICLLVYAMTRYRNIDNGGYINYGNAFGFGILTSLFSTVLYVAYFFVMFISNAEVVKGQLMVVYDEYIEKGLISSEQVNLLLDNIEWLLPVGLFMWSMFLGLVYSLIIAAAVTRKKSVFEE